MGCFDVVFIGTVIKTKCLCMCVHAHVHERGWEESRWGIAWCHVIKVFW